MPSVRIFGDCGQVGSHPDELVGGRVLNGGRITVLGAGSFGTTVASLLCDRAEVVLWARRAETADEISRRRTNAAYLGEARVPDALRATSSIDAALEGSRLVVLAVPSHARRAVLATGAGALAPGAAVLSLVKGLEEGTDLRMSELVAQLWPGRDVAVLTGPNFALEILAGQPTASVVASHDGSLAAALQELLGSDRLRVYTNPDVVGCEVAGVVKNVMAIACGMAIGLGLGDNTRAALITRALAELTRLGVALGGDERTFAGLAGVGDLVATCTSTKSRNLSVGIALGSGKSLAEATAAKPTIAEGVRSCVPALDLARRHHVEAPVIEQVVAVCHEGKRPRDTIAALMSRAARAEYGGAERVEV